MPKFIFIIILLTLLTGLAACTTADPAPSDDILAPLPTTDSQLPTLIELLAEDPDLVFFTSGLNSVGLTDDLQSGGPFTVFAPSNVAFSDARLIVSQMDPVLLGEILDNHLVDGAFSKDELVGAGSVVTLVGDALPIIQEGEDVTVDYAPLVTEAKQASNGTLYVIDTLLLPTETGPEKSIWGVLQADGRFTTFISILEGSEMMGSLRFEQAYDAILAPTDDAFAAMPANVSAYLETDPHAFEFVAAFHLLSPDGWPQGTDLTSADMLELGTVQTRAAVSGSGFGFGFEELAVSQTDDGMSIGEARIIEADIDASNGIVHVIDTVLIPQGLLEHIP